jgi:AcrR family transcriptional regulator
MTMTPWGDSNDLRNRRLQPGPGVPRDEVERNQRERLYGATVVVVAKKGYGKATVADLTDMAGVSRTTFYRYFADKEACFLEALEKILASVGTLTRSGLKERGSWRKRSEAGLRTFLGLLAAQPDAARICVVEAYAAGDKAGAMVDATAAEFAQMLAGVFEQMPSQRGMPTEIVDAMVAGIQKLLQTRLQRGTEGELIDLVPDLIDLGLSYRPPPQRLPNRAPRGKTQPTASRYEGIDEPAQRLELAAMEVVARDGYADATMAAIAGHARVSLATLYAIFDDKDDLLEAAMLRTRLRMIAAVVPPYHRADSWAAGVAAMTRAILAFLEAEPNFTRLVTVEIYGAGTAALEDRDRALDDTRHFIEAGIPYPEKKKLLVAEVIQSVLYGMLSARVRSRHKNLQGMAPLAIYMALAPVLGPEEAYRHAVE